MSRRTSADAQRAHSAAQRRIRRRCTCGRTITGNVAWWSHLHTRDGAKRDGHGWDGRA